MLHKKKPVRPETDEEIAKYRKLGFIFTTTNPFLESFLKEKEGLSYLEASFCKSQQLGVHSYKKIKDIFLRGGKQSVISLFRRNRLKLSKCKEIIDFLAREVE